MKKCLLLSILFGLAAAHGEELATVIPTFYSDGATVTTTTRTITWDSNVIAATDLANYALSFSIDFADTATTDRSYHVLSMGTGNSAVSGLTVTVTRSSESADQLTLTNGGSTIAGALTLDFTEKTVYTLAVLDGQAYLWEGSDISADHFVSGGWNIPSSVTDSTLTKNASRGWPNRADGVAMSPVTLTQLADISSFSKPVPEPATATLSLLALAGLAARRRRK